MKNSFRLGGSDRAVLTALMPHLVLPLVRKGLISESDLADPKALYAKVAKHSKLAATSMEFSVGVHDDFLAQSLRSWRRGERSLAAVLYATAVEQYINTVFQLLLLSRGWKKGHATCLLKAVPFDGKIGWLFEAVSGNLFPAKLAGRLRTVFSIRNGLVHFKGEPGNPDLRDDSFSKVKQQMTSLKRMSLSRDFRLLEEACVSALVRSDPDRVLACRAAHAINKLLASGSAAGKSTAKRGVAKRTREGRV